MNSSSANEKDELLSEVRELKKAVASLEARLAGQDDDVEDVWGIWPYCWVVAGWDRAAEITQGVGQRVASWGNSRRCQASGGQLQGCRKTGRGIITIKPV